MLFDSSTFIGVVLSAGGRQFSYAALDGDLKPMALGQGRMKDVLAFVGGQQQAVVGMNAPLSLNQGLMADETRRGRLSPPPPKGKYKNARLAEYRLFQREFPTYQTPGQENELKGWMKKSFELSNRLNEAGYQNYPQKSDRQLIETAVEAAYHIWLGAQPFPAASLEGRLQRQLVMYDLGVDVPDAMMYFEEVTRFRILQGRLPEEGLYSSDELLAVAGAYLVWAAVERPGEVEWVGDKAEGQILIPKIDLGIDRPVGSS